MHESNRARAVKCESQSYPELVRFGTHRPAPHFVFAPYRRRQRFTIRRATISRRRVKISLRCSICRSALDAKSLQNILDFLSYIDCNILRGGAFVSAAVFHNEATNTLDQLYKGFARELTQISCRQTR